MNNIDAAWLAGLIEGEGYIGKYPVKSSTDGWRCRLCVEMTDEDVVKKAASIAGCGSVGGPYVREGTNYKPTWKWSVGQKHDLQILLARLKPFMHTRRTESIVDVQHRFLELIGVPKR